MIVGKMCACVIKGGKELFFLSTTGGCTSSYWLEMNVTSSRWYGHGVEHHREGGSISPLRSHVCMELLLYPIQKPSPCSWFRNMGSWYNTGK